MRENSKFKPSEKKTYEIVPMSNLSQNHEEMIHFCENSWACVLELEVVVWRVLLRTRGGERLRLELQSLLLASIVVLRVLLLRSSLSL